MSKQPLHTMSAATVSEPTPICNDYMPIEFLLMGLDDKMASWLVDQAGVLRSVFTLGSYDEIEISESFFCGAKEGRIEREEIGKFHLTVEGALSTVCFEDCAVVSFLQDGTAVLVIEDGEMLTCYHLCFEEMSEDVHLQYIQEALTWEPPAREM